jgi:hypothetical protein
LTVSYLLQVTNVVDAAALGNGVVVVVAAVGSC